MRKDKVAETFIYSYFKGLKEGKLKKDNPKQHSIYLNELYIIFDEKFQTLFSSYIRDYLTSYKARGLIKIKKGIVLFIGPAIKEYFSKRKKTVNRIKKEIGSE